MRIERAELNAALIDFARAGHGVVLGRPGIGKTHALAELGRSLTRVGVPFLFLSIEELGEATEEDLRLSLHYSGTFDEAIAELFSASLTGGVVIFDGFDAARNEQTRARILQHIRSTLRRAPTGWSVIVSVRNYDAARSSALLSLFSSNRLSPAAPPRFTNSGFAVRHFAVPELTDAEVLSAVAQISGFQDMFGRASNAFRALMHVPFNLWLVERLMQKVPDPRNIGALESETELLALFWTTLITAVPDSDARTVLLQNAVDRMIDSRRLSVDKSGVYQAAMDSSWRALFSDEILGDAGPGAGRVSFAHNILFDYAVSVLAISEQPSELVAFLTEDRSRPLFLRPSLVYFFARLWHGARDQFWADYWYLVEQEDVAVRLVGRLIPPFVAASEAKSASDLEPVASHQLASPSAQSTAVLRLFQALRFADTRSLPAWLDLAEQVSHRPDPSFAWEVGGFLSRAADNQVAIATNSESVGRTARTLFSWAWNERSTDKSGWYDAFLGNLIVPLVVKTFGTSPPENAVLARRILALIEVPNFPIRLVTSLVDDLQRIIPYEPALVAEIYQVIFGHSETSDAKTHLGGIILSLTSTRRQDFSMCHYVLAKAYPGFLKAAPRFAVPVGINVLNRLSITEHILPYLKEGRSLEDGIQTFRFLARERSFLPDFSLSWEQVGREEETNIASAIVDYLAGSDLELDPTDAVALIADTAVAAVSWRKLLEAGARAPQRFAHALHPLTLARPIQMGGDTLQDLGEFVEQAAIIWSDEERKTFEVSVLGLVNVETSEETTEADAERYERRVRDRLLARVPKDLLVTSEAKQIINALTARNAVPDNEPLVQFGVSSRAYDEDEWLKDQGVDVAATRNSTLRTVTSDLDAFAKRWMNNTPENAAIAELIPLMQRALEILNAIEASLDENAKPDAPVIEQAWTHLASAAGAVARSHPSSSSAVYTVTRAVLTTAASRPLDERTVVGNADYTWASWSPSPRTEAIQGLTYLTWREPDPDASETLATFALSRAPSERLLVFLYGSRGLALTAPTIFWAVIERAAVNEQNEIVVTALLSAIGYAPRETREKVEPIIQQLEQRWQNATHKDLRRALADWLVLFAVRRDAHWAWDRLRYHLAADRPGTGLLEDSSFISINLVTVGSVMRADEAPVVARAIGWIREVIESLRHQATRLAEMAHEDPNEEMIGSLRAVHSLINWIVSRIYFNARRDEDPEASNDGGDEDGLESEALQANPIERLAAYYRAIRPILEDLLRYSDEGIGGVRVPDTAHHFMQLLNVLLPIDATGVLDLAAHLVSTASAGGYHLDSMAVGEAVKMVEKVLADYRSEITSGKPLDDMLRLLDVFADAGWPEALRLVWRLDEVFR
jgi:hypothetical protein